MEALIALTDIDLIDRVQKKLSNQDFQLSRDEDLHILSKKQTYVRVSKISYKEIYDDWLLQKHEQGNLNFYAFYYNNIDLLKSILKIVDYENLWLNNDFEEQNYTYQEFINRIKKNPEWDWRIKKPSKWQFQGQEKIDELEINYAHFKWRLHDPAIGRFISVDPLSEKYVHNSTYAFSENKVTAHIELEGLEAVSAVMYGDAMHLKSATVKQKNEYYGGIAGNLLSLTDINDVTVLATTITRGNNAVNIDGTKASVLDKIFAAGGAAIPYVSGSAIKRVGNTIGEALDLTNNFVEGNKFWQKVSVFDNVKVFQRDDIFNPSKVSSWKENGKVITGNNIERMASGRAPVGNDGKTVNLHHLIQKDGAGMAEMTQTFHKKNHKVIHINPNTIPSGIKRDEFNSWRSNYWINRSDFKE